MTNATLRGKPDAGNPHVRFDEGEVAPAKPGRGSLLYKKVIFTLVTAFCVLTLRAAPGISNVLVEHDRSSRTIKVTYDVTSEPAVVTLAGVTANNEVLADAHLLNVSGDVNRRVEVGTGHTLMWCPPPEVGLGSYAANTFSVTLKAWATNAPPDWMVVDLCVPEHVRYYATSNAIPGGVSDVRYKTDYLVLRRIPAAGVEWRMGSPSTEVGAAEYRSNEHTHYVMLDEDYYLGVYPVTLRQFAYLMNANSDVDKFTSVGGSDDDWPVCGLQYVSLRSWMHNGSTGEPCDCGVHIPCWPDDGRVIAAEGSPKCGKVAGTYTPQLRTMRDRYGLEFDLPTDAQWEFACRGGALGEESRYGELDEIAWYLNNSSNSVANCCMPHPVGLKRPNGYGLCDMIGCIAELCVDYYAESVNAAEVFHNPIGPTNCVNDRTAVRVTRGGSFDAPTKLCRAAARKDIASTWVDNPRFSGDTKGMVARNSNGFRLWLPCHASK